MESQNDDGGQQQQQQLILDQQQQQPFLLDTSLLPLPFDNLPDSVSSLKECAAFQVRQLLELERNDSALLSESEEQQDCLDDGFVLCDLSVIVRKYWAWRSMFPRVRPYYALKCNPDPNVAHVLAQLNAGFDCASVSELHLAQTALSAVAAAYCNRNNKTQQLEQKQMGRSEKPQLHPHPHPQQEWPSFDIVYANPQRAERDLDTALQMFDNKNNHDDASPVLPPPLTFDGPEELYKVHHAAECQQKETVTEDDSNNKNKRRHPPPNMILRILVPDDLSTVPLGEKFGAHESAIGPLLDLAEELHLPVIGVSFHCGSGNHHPESYVNAIRLAAQTLEGRIRSRSNTCCAGTTSNNYSRSVEVAKKLVLDIGGGYPGVDGMGGDVGRFGSKDDDTGEANNSDSSNKTEESTAKIAQAVTPLLDELFPSSENEDIDIIAEPGRYFVEGAFALCSRIYRIRVEADRRHYFIAQGVQGVFKDCVLCGETFFPIPLKANNMLEDDGQKQGNSAASEQPDETVVSTVHGPSGEDYDVICRDYALPILEIGDWLVFDRMGAYTLSIAARNGRPPVRYVMGPL